MDDASFAALPHHKLIAFEVARDLLLAVHACRLRDAKLRDEATRSAKSACLNTAEGAGRVTRADKARAFAIARAETVEAAAAVEIALLCGDCGEAEAQAVARIASRLVGLAVRSPRIDVTLQQKGFHRVARNWFSRGRSRPKGVI